MRAIYVVCAVISLRTWTLTVPGEILVPHGPHLHDEERSPAHDVGEHDDEGHFDGAEFGTGDGAHAAHRRLADQRARAVRRAALCLTLDVLPDAPANKSVTQDEHGDRDEKDAYGDPGDVGAHAPRLDEVSPAVVHVRASFNLAEREDEILRGAEHHTAQPRACDHEARAARGPLQTP